MASARQTRITQRRKTQRERQRQRTERRKTRQENRTRRVEGRQAIWKEKVKQKGKSGFWTPEGIGARGDVAGNLLDKGIQIATLATPQGKLGRAGLGLLGGTSPTDEMDFFAQEQGRRSDSFAGGGGGGSTAIEATQEEAKPPIWQNPIVIASVVGGGLLIYTMTRKKNGKRNGNGNGY